MRHIDELDILDHLGRGSKAKANSFSYSIKSTRQNHGHYNKNINQSIYSPQKAVDLVRIAQKKTQAIYKISSFGKSQQRILAHLRYITRNGKLELEDEDGNKLSQSLDRKELINRWSMDFNDRSRDTMHLVLSTPPGTDRQNALNACKEFLKEEYGKSGHEDVVVAHNDTDHPHIHAVINMTSCYGSKLNPRKAYLRNVRKYFAQICREHDIDVEASSRCERGLSGSSKRSEFIRMKKTNRKPYKDLELIKKIISEKQQANTVKHPSTDLILKRNQIIRKRYAMKAKELFELSKIQSSVEQKDKYFKASKLIEKFTKDIPRELTRGDQVEQQLKSIYEISKNKTLQQKQNYEQGKSLTKDTTIDSNIIHKIGIHKSSTTMLNPKCIKPSGNNGPTNKIQFEQAQEIELDLDD